MFLLPSEKHHIYELNKSNKKKKTKTLIGHVGTREALQSNFILKININWVFIIIIISSTVTELISIASISILLRITFECCLTENVTRTVAIRRKKKKKIVRLKFVFAAQKCIENKKQLNGTICLNRQ